VAVEKKGRAGLPDSRDLTREAAAASLSYLEVSS